MQAVSLYVISAQVSSANPITRHSLRSKSQSEKGDAGPWVRAQRRIPNLCPQCDTASTTVPVVSTRSSASYKSCKIYHSETQGHFKFELDFAVVDRGLRLKVFGFAEIAVEFKDFGRVTARVQDSLRRRGEEGSESGFESETVTDVRGGPASPASESARTHRLCPRSRGAANLSHGGPSSFKFRELIIIIIMIMIEKTAFKRWQKGSSTWQKFRVTKT
eukprot:3412778-Rhodomonas_salina.2